MPFKSKAQRAFMHANHPKIANRWEKEGTTPKKLPVRVSSKQKEDLRNGYRRH